MGIKFTQPIQGGQEPTPPISASVEKTAEELEAEMKARWNV